MTDFEALAELYAAEIRAGWPTNSTYGQCADPQFTWLPLRQCWSACTTCGRLAWSHSQSDPLQDVRNHVERLRNGGDHKPPAMKPTLHAAAHLGPVTDPPADLYIGEATIDAGRYDNGNDE